MPRPALSKVPTTSLQAEIERRVGKLAELLKLRRDLDRAIAELEPLAEQFGKAASAAPPAKPAARQAGRRRAKRRKFAMTGEQFILNLLADSPRTTAELAAEWNKAGRGGKVDNKLSRLVKAGRISKSKVAGVRGSRYAVGTRAAKARRSVAKPVARKKASKAARAARAGKFAQTADQFVLAQLHGQTLTTRQLAELWKSAGRGGTVDSQLSLLTKAGKLQRRPLGGKLGSEYSLA